MPVNPADALAAYDETEATWTALRNDLGDDDYPTHKQYGDHDDALAEHAWALAEALRTVLAALPATRLEHLRGELRAERISQGELIELAELAPFIDRDDVELREAAGLPEHDPGDFVCAECGTAEANVYVVTGPVDGGSNGEDRTEVCLGCHDRAEAIARECMECGRDGGMHAGLCSLA